MPQYWPTPTPVTWAAGDHVSAARLRNDVSGSVGFHTARAVYNSTQSNGLNQNVNNSTWTAATLDNALLDPLGGHSNSTNPSRYVVQVAGWYLAMGAAAFSSVSTAASNTYITGLRINGSNVAGNLFEGDKIPGGNNHGIVPFAADLLGLNVGDYVELGAFQNSGSATTLASSSSGSPTINSQPYLTLTWVSSLTGTTAAAVPSMSTWTNGTAVTAATLNNQVRDPANFFTYPPIVRLSYQGNTPASQSQPNNAFTSVSWDTANIDNYSGWGGTGSNPTRWVVPRTGTYLCIGQSAVAASFTGKRAVKFLINGTTSVTGQHVSAVAAAGHGAGTSACSARLLGLTAGNYVEVQGFQNSGSASNLTTGTAHCKFCAVWVCS